MVMKRSPSGDETPTSAAGLPGLHTRTGKIARLPLAIRQELNRRLRDGQAGQPLLDWLNGLPEVRAVLAAEFQGQPINKQNLSHWRQGGYQDDMADEKAQQEVKLLLAEIGGLREAGQEGLTEQLAYYLSVLAALELKRLKTAPVGEEKAKLWREVRASLVALRRGDMDVERLRLQREKYGLRKMTKEEREAEFWKWADENINRDEFCRRRCYTAEEREAAMDKILGLTPQERHETVPPDAAATSGETGGTKSNQVPPSQA